MCVRLTGGGLSAENHLHIEQQNEGQWERCSSLDLITPDSGHVAV